MKTRADETWTDKIGALHDAREKIRSILPTHDVGKGVVTCPE